MAKKESSGLKVLVGKASFLIGKNRIKKGDRISAEDFNALPDNRKTLFADEVKAVKSLKPEATEEEIEK
jgi:hypothetical protein